MLGAAVLQDIGSVFRVPARTIVEVGQQYEVAHRRESPRHVVKLVANTWCVHEEQHDRVRAAALGMTDKRLHRPILGPNIGDAFNHLGGSPRMAPVAASLRGFKLQQSLWE